MRSSEPRKVWRVFGGLDGGSKVQDKSSHALILAHRLRDDARNQDLGQLLHRLHRLGAH
jgi:hypothetical protein